MSIWSKAKVRHYLSLPKAKRAFRICSNIVRRNGFEDVPYSQTEMELKNFVRCVGVTEETESRILDYFGF